MPSFFSEKLAADLGKAKTPGGSQKPRVSSPVVATPVRQVSWPESDEMAMASGKLVGLLLVTTPELLCRGVIGKGDGTRFCCRLVEECSVGTHQERKVELRSDAYYIRGPKPYQGLSDPWLVDTQEEKLVKG